MQIYDPVLRCSHPDTEMQTLGEVDGWRPVRYASEEEPGPWFALKLSTNESRTLDTTPDEVRLALETFVLGFEFEELLLEACALTYVGGNVAEIEESYGAATSFALDALVEGRDDAVVVRSAIRGAHREGYSYAVISSALAALDEDGCIQLRCDALEGVAVVNVTALDESTRSTLSASRRWATSVVERLGRQACLRDGSVQESVRKFIRDMKAALQEDEFIEAANFRSAATIVAQHCGTALAASVEQAPAHRAISGQCCVEMLANQFQMSVFPAAYSRLGLRQPLQEFHLEEV